jgi:hypothetical protein
MVVGQMVSLYWYWYWYRLMVVSSLYWYRFEVRGLLSILINFLVGSQLVKIFIYFLSFATACTINVSRLFG